MSTAGGKMGELTGASHSFYPPVTLVMKQDEKGKSIAQDPVAAIKDRSRACLSLPPLRAMLGPFLIPTPCPAEHPLGFSQNPYEPDRVSLTHPPASAQWVDTMVV